MKKYINILTLAAAVFCFAACGTNDYYTFGDDYVDNQDYTGQEYTTVTFEGNPSCIYPDVRYMTCQVYGDKVKAWIHTGKRDTNGTSNTESGFTFDLPDAATESGEIKLNDNYTAKWSRKRRDVRISAVEHNSRKDITEFTFGGHNDAGRTEVKSAQFTVADGKVSAVFTLGGDTGTQVTTDSVDLPSKSLAEGSFTLTANSVRYTVAWSRVTGTTSDSKTNYTFNDTAAVSSITTQS